MISGNRQFSRPSTRPGFTLQLELNKTYKNKAEKREVCHIRGTLAASAWSQHCFEHSKVHKQCNRIRIPHTFAFESLNFYPISLFTAALRHKRVILGQSHGGRTPTDEKALFSVWITPVWLLTTTWNTINVEILDLRLLLAVSRQ